MSLLWKNTLSCTNDIRKPPSLSGKFSCWCSYSMCFVLHVHVYFPIINFRGQIKLSNNKSCFAVFQNLKFYCCMPSLLGPANPNWGVFQLHWLWKLCWAWQSPVWVVHCGAEVFSDVPVPQCFWDHEMGAGVQSVHQYINITLPVCQGRSRDCKLNIVSIQL